MDVAKKVLVVEDDVVLRGLYEQILKEAGFDIDSAVDGEAGITAMGAKPYDLVLLDIILPKMDGLSVLRKLQAEPLPVMPKKIVVLSNLGQDDVVAQAMSAGAEGYMIKSDYTPDQVVNQVKSFLG